MTNAFPFHCALQQENIIKAREARSKLIGSEQEPFVIKPCSFHSLAETERLLRIPPPFETDGLVFSPNSRVSVGNWGRIQNVTLTAFRI
jgi:hypothetical protein